MAARLQRHLAWHDVIYHFLLHLLSSTSSPNFLVLPPDWLIGISYPWFSGCLTSCLGPYGPLLTSLLLSSPSFGCFDPPPCPLPLRLSLPHPCNDFSPARLLIFTYACLTAWMTMTIDSSPVRLFGYSLWTWLFFFFFIYLLFWLIDWSPPHPFLL